MACLDLRRLPASCNVEFRHLQRSSRVRFSRCGVEISANVLLSRLNLAMCVCAGRIQIQDPGSESPIAQGIPSKKPRVQRGLAQNIIIYVQSWTLAEILWGQALHKRARSSLQSIKPLPSTLRQKCAKACNAPVHTFNLPRRYSRAPALKKPQHQAPNTAPEVSRL